MLAAIVDVFNVRRQPTPSSWWMRQCASSCGMAWMGCRCARWRRSPVITIDDFYLLMATAPTDPKAEVCRRWLELVLSGISTSA